MAYSEELDTRIEAAVSRWGTTRRKMFGGVCYLIHGNMMCGVHQDSLILRLGEVEAEVSLKSEGVGPFDITGRPMKGWVMVSGAGLEGRQFLTWLETARSFAGALPPK